MKKTFTSYQVVHKSSYFKSVKLGHAIFVSLGSRPTLCRDDVSIDKRQQTRRKPRLVVNNGDGPEQHLSFNCIYVARFFNNMPCALRRRKHYVTCNGTIGIDRISLPFRSPNVSFRHPEIVRRHPPSCLQQRHTESPFQDSQTRATLLRTSNLHPAAADDSNAYHTCRCCPYIHRCSSVAVAHHVATAGPCIHPSKFIL